MGYSVNVRVYDGGPTTGPRLANGTSSDVALELWPSDASTWYEKYVQLENSIVDYGSVGYTGRVGLYFPSYMLDQYPQYETLDFWKMLVHPETQMLFPRSGSGPHATHSNGSPICDGNPFGCVNGTYKPSWYTDSEKQNFVEIWMETMETTVYYFQRLVDGLHLNATLNFMGNDAFSNLVSAYETKKPFLAYQWRPTTTLAGLNLTRIIFPDDSIGAFKKFQKDPVHTPVTVDIPVENLFKASSAKFAIDFPELSYYLSKFSIPEQSIDLMLSKIPTTVGDWTDTSYTDTTCDWLKTHESLWATWIPPPPVSQSQCPIGTGRYLSNSLYVCLKCLPGTYNLNATTTQECDSCPENASCPGGATVNVNAMFWMPVTPSNITGDYVPEIHLCPHGKQCCPTGNCTSTAICEEGFTGVFCTECADSSLYPWNGKCVTCSSAGGSFYLTVILPAFFTAAVIFVPKYHAAEVSSRPTIDSHM
ncbi:hypothetical protein BCR33DRAFT_64122 [Rhizoclosmatium globosum]|uniref:ABC-type glycine betaine transport system substrate-binding domain-containing protein n=1 Tax=Rhizoclosmatium globosum TaxID=329046 RepID=A0A1Y2CMQ9_9FUNG|nr:hypothetical protein BCR33DRAFT_64122 [Rhizoclosmatium globosum]|eukprot:ORY48310.1 hypothetical protein BCR33DRAFT_64122 [Rhizoclosmatium globosum]